MNGLTEDLISGVVRDIEREWKPKGGNMSYFIGLVTGARLTPKDLDKYLQEHGNICHKGVRKVFSAIVREDSLNKEKGGQS